MFYNFKNTNFKRKIDQVKTPEELYDEYNGRCIASGVYPTLSGLARMLGFSDLKSFRKECDNNLEYQDFVLRIQQIYEENLIKQGGNSSGAQFALTSMFGWKDEKNLVITSSVEKDDLKELPSDKLRELLND